MARRKTNTKPKISSSDDSTVSPTAAKILERVTKALKDKELSFKLSVPATLTIVLASGEYRKKRFVGDEEFIFSDTRIGKKGTIIFQFEPFDPQPDFVAIEVESPSIFQIFPKFSVAAIDLMFVDMRRIEDGGTTARDKIDAVMDTGDIDEAFRVAVSCKEEMIKIEAVRAETAERDRVAKAYVEDPNFGSW